MRYPIMVALIAALSGCATTQEQDVVWYKKGFGKTDYDASDRVCTYDGQKAYIADQSPLRGNYNANRVYEACMKSKGWDKVPRASVPPDDLKRLYQPK